MEQGPEVMWAEWIPSISGGLTSNGGRDASSYDPAEKLIRWIAECNVYVDGSGNAYWWEVRSSESDGLVVVY